MSPWHDIPLRPHGENRSNVFNFVNEISKGTRAKMEIAGEEAHNPIKQDVKKGNLRFYHFDSLVNYGCIPQTWEDPAHIDPATQHCLGDNDPIDVCEIGSRVASVGDVYPVKVLGVLGMIDDGETDWKVIAIATDDPLAAQLHDLDDLQKHAPATVAAIRDWFRDYKIPDGKPPSAFAFDGHAKPRVRREGPSRCNHASVGFRHPSHRADPCVLEAARPRDQSHQTVDGYQVIGNTQRPRHP
ncbi:hypothetical protein DYB32_005640 [Aphanomyces invadans]|uniref:inorganic diphosphatase n=1 Tax=Aphanomyces invadans TaxID=157072 RepID=A0A3R7CZD8_9STRA|nr:hypothetical protein DYB32_005640 [Aphanomyces invadans]